MPTDSPRVAPSAELQAVLEHFSAHGSVVLRGHRSEPVLRWLKHRRTATAVAYGVLGVGVLALVAGLVLRDVGLWPVLIPVGLFCAFAGVVVAGVLGINTRLMSHRLQAEEQPVVIDPAGITLRGIGPVPWRDVAPPERRRIWVKNDIGGRCTVMPLTEEGRRRADQQPGPWPNLVGPRPYLRTTVPCLMLPGVEGLTEDETMHLFGTAHQRYAR